MQNKEMVIRYVKKCESITDVYGSGNNEVNRRGLNGNIMSPPKKEYYLESEDVDDGTNGESEVDEGGNTER